MNHRAKQQLAQQYPGQGQYVMALLAMALAIATQGCEALGLGAKLIVGDNEKTVDVLAEYSGLSDHTAAVMITADDVTLFQYPRALNDLAEQFTDELSAAIPTAKLNPIETAYAYQEKHPYWHTMPYEPVFEALDVQRLIVVELVQFVTHDPGNPHVRRGSLIANVRVVEDTNPDTLAYRSTVQVHYPKDRPIGTIHMSDQEIQQGMAKVFAQRATLLFIDHTIKKKR